MPNNHTVKSREIGQVRIHTTPGERRVQARKGLKSLLSGSTPLYVEIIKSAKQDGL